MGKTVTDRVQQWGIGEHVLVFLHYFGGSALSWQWVSEQLSDDYHCIAFNFPGFGNYPAIEEPSIQAFAKFVEEELEQMGITSFTLLGHSMGGKIALQIAANIPKSVKRLILIAPSPPTIENMPEKEKARMLRHPDREEAENTVANVTIRSLTEAQHNLAIETQLIIDASTWRWWLLKGMGHSIAHQQWHMPITIIASKDDTAITFDMIQQEVLPVLMEANLIVTEGVGHLLPLEVPDWLAMQIREIVPIPGRAK